MDVHPVLIAGKVTLSDGSVTEFNIMPEYGWQQWGNYREQLVVTVDLMEAIQEVAHENGLRHADEEG
jgi:hypothetical protein